MTACQGVLLHIENQCRLLFIHVVTVGQFRDFLETFYPLELCLHTWYESDSILYLLSDRLFVINKELRVFVLKILFTFSYRGVLLFIVTIYMSQSFNDVTVENLAQLYPKILSTLEDATFIAIDTEFTGLGEARDNVRAA
jgi:hypothetical protein